MAVIPEPPVSTPGRRVPLWLKLALSAFVAVQVPFYWYSYGPTNFLYFCDVALLLTLAAVWLESPLLASMPTVGILLPQMLWVTDFLCGLTGHPLTGMTNYMFDEKLLLFSRLISLFHGWLPFLLLWLVYRLGYDRRALAAWTLLAWVLMTVCYFLMPAPPAPAETPNLPVNINYVYGMSDEQPQSWMPANAYFVLMLVAFPVCLFLPAHFFLRLFFPAVETTTPVPAVLKPSPVSQEA